MKLNLSLVTCYSSLFLFFTFPLKAQVTIGDQKAPEAFSLLELIGNNKGLRMPQLTTLQRDALNLNSSPDAARGLVIYNTSIRCLEFWNSVKWISLCNSVIGTDPPPDFSLFYSEGNLLMTPSASLPANYSMSNLTNSAKHTITMTSPIDFSTTRYFTCLSAAGTDSILHPATISLSTIANPYGDPTVNTANAYLHPLNIPQGYVGKITLTIGAAGNEYVTVIDVQANRTPSNGVKIGETFTADGYEWRVLAKGDNSGD